MCWFRFHTSSVINWTCEDHREDRGDGDTVLSGPDLDFSLFFRASSHLPSSHSGVDPELVARKSARLPPLPRGKQWPGPSASALWENAGSLVPMAGLREKGQDYKERSGRRRK